MQEPPGEAFVLMEVLAVAVEPCRERSRGVPEFQGVGEHGVRWGTDGAWGSTARGEVELGIGLGRPGGRRRLRCAGGVWGVAGRHAPCGWRLVRECCRLRCASLPPWRRWPSLLASLRLLPWKRHVGDAVPRPEP